MAIPLVYSFGNHMHWVDMEWLWGYRVLPDSVADMIRFCEETGAKGNLNFDGVGYEKLAAENPAALSLLKDAIANGQIEPVGCSYGQPYGLFHGGESNVRQRVYGVRTVMRLLGVRPKTFWEEEFDFFPQLPQVLKGVGFEYASLFFQWTWHTPEVPKESVPAVLWQSPDGSSLVAATRNELNLHQWPEDMQILFDQLEAQTRTGGSCPTPLILQWLELMPSPDWMCRSELLIPKMKALLSDERFDIRFATLSGYLAEAAKADLPTRSYSMDEVWHGMSLGKNGDRMRRLSRVGEATLLSAETASAVLGLFGRPYPRWDVYPTWELEEAWRELLQAQHHDNDECEGLCGHVGLFSYERSLSLSRHVLEDALGMLAARCEGKKGDLLCFNPLGWRRSGLVRVGEGESLIVDELPAFGFRVVEPTHFRPGLRRWVAFDEGFASEPGGFEVSIDREGAIRSSEGWPALPVFRFRYVKDDFEMEFLLLGAQLRDEGRALLFSFGLAEARIEVTLTLPADEGCMDVRIEGSSLERPDGGMNAGLSISFAFEKGSITTDHPYGVSQVSPTKTFQKKYPTGDWMTSPQWFEKVDRPFHASSFVDLCDEEGAGLLIVHDGSQQWFWEEGSVRNLLTMYDPWDEQYWVDSFEANYRLIPHDRITNSRRWRLGQNFLRPIEARIKHKAGGDIPANFEALSIESQSTLATALYRETEDSGAGLDSYAGKGLAHPFVLRLVELDGIESGAELHFGVTLGNAFKANLMGEKEGDLDDLSALTMRGYEIATVYLDLPDGRKRPRDLDAARQVWATVHRATDGF